MFVCKAFYQQFEWASKSHWEAVSEYPVLICMGDDDKVTPIKGAQALHKLLLLQSTGKETTATENTREGNCSTSAKSESLKSTDSTGRVRFSVIRNAGHHVFEEQPEQLASLMDSFFSEACGLSLCGGVAVN